VKKRFIFFLVFLLSTFIKTGLSQDETPDRELMMDVQAGGYVSISPTAVKPYLSDDYAFTFWTTSTEFYFQSTGGCMVTPMAPVNLPHGKTVTGFGVSYTDNGDGIDDSIGQFFY